MDWVARFAILIDGEFAKKTLQKHKKHFPTPEDLLTECARIQSTPPLTALELYRVYYYTADPLAGKVTHPIDHTEVDFSSSQAYARNNRLIQRLENAPNVAVRRGTLAHQGWEIGSSALRGLTHGKKTQVEAKDIIPKIQQKGVDMRMGLDIASLALQRIVSTIVIVSGDSDLVPAMKLARREGLRVYLDTVGSTQIRPELKIHADVLL